MKKIVSILCTLVVIIFLLVNIAAAQSSKRSTGSNAAINGAWQRAYYYSGKTTTTSEPKEFVLVYDGFFSSIGQDSSGRWANTYAGSFEISGNIMKSHLLYSSHAERVGSTQWIEFELVGDTLDMKWFKKLITPQGQDITAQMPRVESKYIRAEK